MRPKIGFIGSMNAMPMAYALKFRRDAHDVRYAVEAPADDVLMRPEHQYGSEVSWPYPDWIIERTHPYTLASHAFAPWVYRDIARAMQDRDIVFLNDYGLALAPQLPARTVCVALSSGSDIDVYCNPEAVWANTLATRRKALVPLRWLLEHERVRRQRRGLARCDIVCTFPTGLNPVADRLIAEFVAARPRVRVVHRYDVNFAAAGVTQQPQPQRRLTKVLVPVRFNTNPPAASRFEYKGNDLIIEALARFSKVHAGLEIHLFAKGPAPDIERARQQIRDGGIESSVIWHDQMPLPELLKLYADSDVCFDQVGSHWMGAVGCYALYTGRPLIANARLDVFAPLWGEDPPILQADSVDSILAQLQRCVSQSFRNEIGARAHAFAARQLDTERVYDDLRREVYAVWQARAGRSAGG